MIFFKSRRNVVLSLFLLFLIALGSFGLYLRGHRERAFTSFYTAVYEHHGSDFKTHYTEFTPAIEMLSFWAAMGDGAAKCHLSWSYSIGAGVEINAEKSTELQTGVTDQLIRLAQWGDPWSMLTLGVAQFDQKKGNECGEDPLSRHLRLWRNFMKSKQKSDPQAIAWLEKAAEQNNPEGLYTLALIHSHFEGNPQIAIPLFEKAAAAGHSDATDKLGLLYSKGYGVNRDMRQAITHWQKGVETGNLNAINNLGSEYIYGNSVPKKETLGFEMIRNAADAGNATGRLNMTGIVGLMAPPKYTDEIELENKASEEDPEAMYILGMRFYAGKGRRQNTREALHWLTLASDKGELAAMVMLGNMYGYGLEGVAKDVKRAIALWEKAAEKGSIQAMQTLENMYGMGYIVPKDLKKKEFWKQKQDEALVRFYH